MPPWGREGSSPSFGIRAPRPSMRGRAARLGSPDPDFAAELDAEIFSHPPLGELDEREDVGGAGVIEVLDEVPVPR